MKQLENNYYVAMFVNEYSEETRLFEVFYTENEIAEYIESLTNGGCSNIEIMEYEKAVSLGLYYS